MIKQTCEKKLETRFKYRNSEVGYLIVKISILFSPSAIKRDYDKKPNCTKEEIYKLFYEHIKLHGRNCYYCGEPWTYIAKKHAFEVKKYSRKGENRKMYLKNLSLDRLDSNKTYSVDNIIFCCVECNLSKKDISIKLIKRLYDIITERKL